MQDMNQDLLTALPSRFALMDHLKSLDHANVFLIDIDNFSNINSAYGFETGDQVIVEAARLIGIAKPLSSKLFRLNSD